MLPYSKIEHRFFPVFFLIFILTLLVLWIYNTTKLTDRNRGKYHVIPDCDRSLNTAVFSLGNEDTSLAFQHELLMRLPEYSEIILILPRDSVNHVITELKHVPYGSRTKLVPFNPVIRDYGTLHFIAQHCKSLIKCKITKPVAIQFGSRWTQDLFEVATCPDGKIYIFSSIVHMCFWTGDNKSEMSQISDTDYLFNLSSPGMEVVRLPVVFNGGNILFDKIGGKCIALCGIDITLNTRMVHKFFPECVAPDSMIAELFKKAFNVNEVFFIGVGENPQPRLVYHLDQAMILLGNGVAGITTIIGNYPDNIKEREEVMEVEQFLAELRSFLLNLGYKLVDIKTPVLYVLNQQNYMNGIPFIDRISGKRSVLMPVFSSGLPQFYKKIESENISKIESLGITVIPVPSKTEIRRGGPHCLVNVLE